MNILELRLKTADPDAQAAFYTTRLGLAAVERQAGERVVLQAGTTRLIFERALNPLAGIYHFAFNIAPELFTEAKTWLAERVGLLRDAGGQDQFDFGNWDSRSVYFLDPAGNVAELIARRALDTGAAGPFQPRHILSVSEMGLAAEDPLALVTQLRTSLGVDVCRGEPNESFNAMGDEQALLIIVRRGRIWMPDSGLPAELMPLEMVLDVPKGRLHLHGPAYSIDA